MDEIDIDMVKKKIGVNREALKSKWIKKKQKMYTEKDLIGKGGKFLVLTALDAGIFSREKFSEEQNMIAKSALDYATEQLKPISN